MELPLTVVGQPQSPEELTRSDVTHRPPSGRGVSAMALSSQSLPPGPTTVRSAYERQPSGEWRSDVAAA